MPPWLAPDYTGWPFQLFGATHLTTLAIIASSCLGLAWLCRRSALSPRHKTLLRYSLAALLLGTHIAWDSWQIAVGIWDIRWSLPLQLCQLTQFLCVPMLLLRSQRLFAFLYFWGFAGATQAILTPNLSQQSFPHIVFLAFFIAHGGVLLALTYMLAAENYRPSWRSLGQTWLLTNALLPLVGLFNWLVGGNYWFLAAPPPTPTLIDYLGPWPWYLLGLQGIALGLFVLLLLPFHWAQQQRVHNVAKL